MVGRGGWVGCGDDKGEGVGAVDREERIGKIMAIGEKRCKYCGEVKPLDRFYDHPQSADGKEVRCKKCKRKYTRILYQNRDGEKALPPQSTVDGREILRLRGYPAVTGVSEFPWADLVVFSCVPIEVKGARKSQQGNFHWSFTPKQINDGFPGLVLFLCYVGDEVTRRFVVPGNLEWLRVNKRGNLRSALAVTFNSNHHNSSISDLLEPYGDAFYLIDQWFANVRYVESI